MNKKFSTLLAGVALLGAMSANAQQQTPVTAKPAATAVANPGQSLAAGDVVYLDYDASWQIDFTGAWTANSHKDSLIWNGAAVVGRSKAHIDSLLFKVDFEKTALDYNGTATFEYAFTFTSKVGKFAFAKPAAKKTASAYLKTDGALNKWVLAEKYLTDGGISTTGFGYVPFVVATRVSATDDTPKTVYVLVKNASGAMEVMEVNYNAAFTRELQSAAETTVAFDPTTGLGTIGSGTYALFRITGQIAQNFDITVAAGNIKDATGYLNPSFKFGTNVSTGEDNLLAAYNWEYTTAGYLKAIGAKQEGTGRDLYLTVDTAFYDVPNTRNYKLALDTLPTAGSAANWIRTADTYKFNIKASFVKDSITVIAQNTPKLTGNYFAQANAPIAVNSNANEELIIKKFGNKTVLTTKYAGDLTPTPSIIPSEFPTWELIDPEMAQFTSGDVYVIYDMNKMNGTQKNEYYGLPLVIDNMQSRTTQKFVNTNKFDQTLPSHQWVALKSDNINVYTFANRETGATADAPRKAAMGDIQLYVIDADENLYTYGSKADTIKMVKIDSKTLSPFDGYRVITKEEQMNKVFSLRFISELLGDEAYVEQNADSAMTVAVGNKDNAAEVRFFAMSTLYRTNDTIKIGVEDHELTVVPYTVKIGRYFLAYDSDKKVYRFTNKQYNEANAEEGQPYYDDRFVITKLAGGNVALVPFTTLLYGYGWEKLAIDSENGNAVRVALDSDLRHAFELTEPANRIFAEVLGNTDTTLVKVNFNSVENLGWKIAKGDNDFLYEGVAAELKAGGAEYESKAFDFKLDTAYVNRPGNTMPLYYITYDAVRGDSVPVSHIHDNGAGHVCPAPLVNDTVSGKFLFMMNDSLNISRANDLKYGYTYNYETYAKLQMIEAKHINDTLIVNRVNPVEADTLKAGDIDEDATVEQMQYQWLNYDNKALFAFRVNMDNKEEYAIYNPATGLYITYLNGFVVATSNAAFYTLKDENGFNVSNENIETSASSIKVMATKGAIQIVGAQGKKVVVSNILGQTVANTVITSDNATIAAPAGVVVVAVEGEEAVKAIVK